MLQGRKTYKENSVEKQDQPLSGFCGLVHGSHLMLLSQ